MCVIVVYRLLQPKHVAGPFRRWPMDLFANDVLNEKWLHSFCRWNISSFSPAAANKIRENVLIQFAVHNRMSGVMIAIRMRTEQRHNNNKGIFINLPFSMCSLPYGWVRGIDTFVLWPRSDRIKCKLDQKIGKRVHNVTICLSKRDTANGLGSEELCHTDTMK